MTSINGALVAVGVDLVPGQQDNWILWGWTPNDYGRVFTLTAAPLSGLPWEIIFEVTNVSLEVDAQGNRRIFATVRNSSPPSSDYGSYGLFMSWTDPL